VGIPYSLPNLQIFHECGQKEVEAVQSTVALDRELHQGCDEFQTWRKIEIGNA